jgi:hypothetical protein
MEITASFSGSPAARYSFNLLLRVAEVHGCHEAELDNKLALEH